MNRAITSKTINRTGLLGDPAASGLGPQMTGVQASAEDQNMVGNRQKRLVDVKETKFSQKGIQLIAEGLQLLRRH